jgi:hypothetical protein
MTVLEKKGALRYEGRILAARLLIPIMHEKNVHKIPLVFYTTTKTRTMESPLVVAKNLPDPGLREDWCIFIRRLVKWNRGLVIRILELP